MNFAMMENVAKNPEKQWYYSLTELCQILGKDRKYVRPFLIEHAVPFQCIGKSKSYFLPDVLEAVDKCKWKAARP